MRVPSELFRSEQRGDPVAVSRVSTVPAPTPVTGHSRRSPQFQDPRWVTGCYRGG